MKYFSCKNLSFYYGKKIIFKNVNFEIIENDIIALVGNNGVGKTTLLKIIANLYKTNQVNHNLQISYLIDKPSFYPYMSGCQNLNYYKILYNTSDKKVEEVLKLLDIYHAKDLKYAKYSLGMKQRLAIAKCLLKDADLYLFDEPLNGLDPGGIILFRKIVKLLKDNHKIVMISSHILKELDSYCNKVFYLNDKGLTVINNDFHNNYYLITLNNNKRIKYNGTIENLNHLIQKLLLENHLIKEIQYHHKSIENLFIKDGDYEKSI